MNSLVGLYNIWYNLWFSDTNILARGMQQKELKNKKKPNRGIRTNCRQDTVFFVPKEMIRIPQYYSRGGSVIHGGDDITKGDDRGKIIVIPQN